MSLKGTLYTSCYLLERQTLSSKVCTVKGMYRIPLRMAKSMVAMKLVDGHFQAATNAIHKDQSLRVTCLSFEHSRKLIDNSKTL